MAKLTRRAFFRTSTLAAAGAAARRAWRCRGCEAACPCGLPNRERLPGADRLLRFA